MPVVSSSLGAGNPKRARRVTPIQSSRSGLKKASIAPEKTTETLQEDKQWLKEQIK